MNPVIRQYVSRVEARLIESPVIVSYQVLRQEITNSDGKFRIKAILTGGGTVELFEYVAESDKHIHLLKYSFHWQDVEGKLIRRWDTPHYHNLLNSPHHIYYENGLVRETTDIPDSFLVIKTIEETLK